MSGNLEILVNVRELSGNFESARFKTSHHPINVFGAVINQNVSRSAFFFFFVELCSDWCVVVIGDFSKLKNCLI